MKKILYTLILMMSVSPLMGQSFNIEKKHECSFNYVEENVKILKEDTRNKNIKFHQKGSTEWFIITWVHEVKIDV